MFLIFSGVFRMLALCEFLIHVADEKFKALNMPTNLQDVVMRNDPRFRRDSDSDSETPTPVL